MSQVSVLPFDSQAILLPPLTDIGDRPATITASRSIPPHAATVCAASKPSPWARTAQAMRASLLASATTTTFLWARAKSPRTHRPSGVSRSAKYGSTARAP